MTPRRRERLDEDVRVCAVTETLASAAVCAPLNPSYRLSEFDSASHRDLLKRPHVETIAKQPPHSSTSETERDAVIASALSGHARSASSSLDGRDVHLWRFATRADAVSERVAPLLSVEEVAHAGRFRCPADRARSVTARGWLRAVLGGYLGCDAREVPIGTDVRGKPVLLSADEGHRLRFNVAHSGAVGLIALARGREVGVDVERINQDRRWERIAEHFFTAREASILRRAAPVEKARLACRWWVRKEALAKATGDGLRMPLDTFDASLASAPPPWTVVDVPVDEGYAAALAVEGGSFGVVRLDVVADDVPSV